MSEIETKNAVITHACITTKDHGLLSAWLTLNYGCSGQGFGGYALYLPESFSHHDKKNDACGRFIWRVLQVADVEDWADLVGKTVRVKGSHQKIESIGHIVKDIWFNPSEELKTKQGET